MEKTNPLSLFIELSSFDQSLNKIRRQIDSLNTENTNLSQTIESIENKLISFKKEVHDTQKSVHEHELNMKELDERLQEQKTLLDRVSNQKEYNAVKSAISQIKQEQHNYETTLIEEWGKLDNIKLKFNKEEKNLVEDAAKIKIEIEQKKDEVSSLTKNLDEQSKSREKFLANLPKEWLEKYEGMHSRVSDPIVPIVQGACGACFHEATPQIIIDLKHRKLIQCKGCYRFLFFEKPETPIAQND